ncbi:hypothetical protein KKA23_01875 [Patescibacteria group bacterium]|nr:hypothetical protein [Patescibacteria group bacterium]
MTNKFKKLVVFDNLILTPKQNKKLKDFGREVIFYPKTNDYEVVKERIKDADAVINCWTVITEDAIKNAKNLKYIGNWGHWWKHRITITEEKLGKLEIHLDHIPDYGTDAVAEVAWAGILALSKNLEKWHKDVATGKWTYENIKRGDKKVDISKIDEHLIKDKTLGIVGMGRIGMRVAEIGLKGFGTKVIYYSRTRKKDIEKDIKFVSIKELFKQSDIISIHVSPDIPKGFISGKLLNSMKSEAIFVNTSVGHAVDQQTLIKSLKQRKIKAFLDVYEQFPPRQDLKDLPNVIFTYRLGWFSQESIQRKGDMLIQNVENYLLNRT